jgi:AraC-like DNA-binding protein
MDIRIITGRFNRVGGDWRKPHPGPEHCYKLYVIEDGTGWVRLAGQRHQLQPGRAYFLDGHRLEDHGTDSFLDVGWLHVAAESLSLGAALQRGPAFYEWSAKRAKPFAPVFHTIDSLLASPSPADACRLQSTVMSMLADVLDQAPPADAAMERFDPAIRFMDDHWADDPPLAEVAAQAALSGEHFHRLFREAFGTTPRAYMLARRMNAARQLLQTTELTVAAVGERVGYRCGFHFSKAFKQHFGQSPSTMRQTTAP